MSHPTALTRYGTEPKRADRATIARTLQALLDEGSRFTAVDAELDPEQLRRWARRLRELTLDLADCVEVPARNRVMEAVSSTRSLDGANAVRFLRVEVARASTAELGLAVGVSGRTVERVEAGSGCQLRVAGNISSYFALSVLELFDCDSLSARTVGELREAMLTPSDFSLPRT
ncbi:MAG TPA: hypothetical protein VI111_03150 [Thermoleophilaceae bacterium]